MTFIGKSTEMTATAAHSSERIRAFFARSDQLDRMALRPLSHITMCWKWDHVAQRYKPEPGTFADDLNVVIDQIVAAARPARYHDHEDSLAERTLRELRWPIQKKGKLWIGADYQSVLEHGAFSDLGQENLIAAAAGRVHAAIDFGQSHFDEMEERHQNMLAALITIAIYHRDCDGSALYRPEEYDEDSGVCPRNSMDETELSFCFIHFESPIRIQSVDACR